MTSQRLLRVGHKGAGLIAPGNTYASFDAALAAAVDMIEFDVLPERPRRRSRTASGSRRAGEGERLVLAHDYEDAAGRSPHTLEEGLDYLASEAFSELEFDVDLKLPGYELRVLEALRAHDLVGRVLISSQYLSSLALIRAIEPHVRLGWSVPKLRRDPFRWPILKPGALAVMHAGRAILPGRAARSIRARRCDALMVHWLLVTPRLVAEVRRAGGELYVWTVDELARLRELEALGVTGVISNDPRLFADLAG